ncbi:DUF2945 domain-containing protein [Komagataeibacter diospyri]|uniref:Hypervirulence associated protein TUDOR domain-containing protein n=1 Tax=Komagataeibacter diospyri TaxID=1932662 RepID=A0A4P5NS23_9PROT|nr:DUF2945 domain-containing protein [Komagataeibacter diospyri]GCE82345.1 hypothetical protein MSKU9_0486 [Komagataeibacter diospyri]GCE88698.1 hypothetical protein MSKU15_0299 [Komagataeibacter diospyri]
MTVFHVGDTVSWPYEGGRTHGTVIGVHTVPFQVSGYTHHATVDEPQYEIRCIRTGHVAFHKPSTLTRET